MENYNPYAAPQAEITEPAPLTNLPLASRWSRLGASILDGFIFFPLMIGINLAMVRLSHPELAWDEALGDKSSWIISLCIALSSILLEVAVNWHFLSFGQTIGKRVLGIQVQWQQGGVPSRKDLIMKRILPLWIITVLIGEIHPWLGKIGEWFAFIEVLFIFRTSKRALHDDFAGTKVVKISS